MIFNSVQVIAQNGVPAVEIARVLQDGTMPAEVIAALEAVAEPELDKSLNGADVDCFVKLYENLKLKANIPEETIEATESRMISMYDNCKRRAANWLQTCNRSTSTKSTMNKLLAITLSYG